MNKRIVVSLLAILILAFGDVLHAQQPNKVWRVGLFHVGLDHVPPSLEPLKEGLKRLGYTEGKNIRLDWRNLPDPEAAHQVAKEFVKNGVDLIVAFEDQTVRAAKAATSEIPVVFLHVADPVKAGFVQSLPHPGGNLTGLAGSSGNLLGKQIELFKELVPQLKRLLLLMNPEDPRTAPSLTEARQVSEGLKIELVERKVRDQPDIERVFSSVNAGNINGTFVLPGLTSTGLYSVILRRTLEKRVPLATHRKEWVEEGGLFSYGPDYGNVGRDAARYIDKIFKGSKPADLPVEQSMRFELLINLKTAKQMGLTISPNVLARADRVIK
jgi:putative tryptophan/tyrosine transport system substrate-binding protein